MSHAADLTAREAEIIRVLKFLSSQIGKFMVVVGGYAVNALTMHRFSVDCDLVIAEKDLMLFERILSQEGYEKKRRREFQGVYGGKVNEYTKLIQGRRVSVDLFLNGMICRQTGGAWSYELIKENSVESNVVGLTDSTVSLVPKKELLMAMKLHSGRDADLRDIIMLSEGADWETVAKFAARGVKKKTIKQIEFAVETISSNKFPSALRAEFSLRSDVTPLIKKAKDGLNKVKNLLPENF